MIDHLVLATDALAPTVAQIVRDWGVTPTPGGAHVGLGTRNELVGIGHGTYLEIVGPDLDQVDHTGARPFGVDRMSGSALVAWCARPAGSIEAAATAALQRGHDVGPISAMSRRRLDDVLLEWRLTFPPATPSVLPFIIDWMHSEHPTTALTHPVELTELRLFTTNAATVRSVIEAIGGDSRITVVDGKSERLQARLRTPAGEVSLSG